MAKLSSSSVTRADRRADGEATFLQRLRSGVARVRGRVAGTKKGYFGSVLEIASLRA
jgi:hypothetical protein